MTQASSDTENNFVVSPKMSGSAAQPLEVYHLSHDLRGPLNSILGFCELLLEGIEGPLNENQEDDISAIYQSAQNLLQMINTLVDLSKLEAGRLSFEQSEVDVAELVQKIMRFDFGTTKAEAVELVASLPEDLPPARGDGNRVQQMVMNMVRFAFKMKKSGQVVLSAAPEDGHVTVQVSLNHLVLTSEQLAELFELAVHTDSAGRSELSLGGMELPLTRGLAEANQGRVWAESTPDFGTRLYLQLPLSQ